MKAEIPSYTNTCVAVFLRKIGGDIIEHPAYRDNLEQILKASNGRQMLTIGDVKEITGIRHYQTLHKLFPFQGRHISAATMARCMCGSIKK